MHTFKNLIIDRLASNPVIGIPKWLSGNPLLLKWLIDETAQYNPKNIMHSVYIILNGPPALCTQNNQLQFNTFTKGYRSGCVKGNQCKCVTDQRQLEQKKTLQKIYGVDNVFQIDSVKQQIKNTNKQRYGVEHSSQNLNIKSKTANSKANRTDEQKQNTKLKTVNTSYLRYGKSHHMQLDSQQQKVKSTNKKKYGIEFPLQSEIFLEQMKITRAESQHSITSKTRKTLEQKYNVTSSSQIKLTQRAREILFDQTKFLEYVNGKERKTVLEDLNIAPHTLYLYAKKYAACELFKRPLTSSFELELADFLDELNISYEQNNRSIINPHEIDFLIASKNIAVECNGLYWHSEHSANRSRNYHYDKWKKCADVNIQLISIHEDEWILKKSIVKNRLINLLVNKNNAIYARKCLIECGDKDQISDFLNKHHIQGSSDFKVGLVLKYNNEIVAVMTFGKSRYNKKFQWELLRYCCSTTVVGGSSKLFAHFVNNYNPSSIVSYSDSRWFTGKMYGILGFSQEKTTVGYQYTDYRLRYDRYNFQKHKLVEQGHDINKSEWQIMQEQGYDRIWDCGQIRWTKNFA